MFSTHSPGLLGPSIGVIIWTAIAIVVAIILLTIAMLHLFFKNNQERRMRFVWFLVILCLPFIGPASYLMFGNNTTSRNSTPLGVGGCAD